MTISLVLDIVTVAVVLLFVVIGFCSGFIKTAVRLIGAVMAAVIAALLSGPLAQWIYSTFVHERAMQMITEKVNQGVADTAATLAEQIEAVTAVLPETLRNMLAVYGATVNPAQGAPKASDALVPTVMTEVITPVCLAVLQVIVFLVLFLILYILARLLGAVIDKVFSSLPLVKQTNQLLGLVVGFGEGVLVLFVLCFGLQLYMSLAGAGSALTLGDIQQTRLLSWVMHINPFI